MNYEKAFNEANNMLVNSQNMYNKAMEENTRLKQEKEELIEWLKERIEINKSDLESDVKNEKFILGVIKAYYNVLSKIKGDKE